MSQAKHKSNVHFFLTPRQAKALRFIRRARAFPWADPRIPAVTANSLFRKGLIFTSKNAAGEVFLHLTEKGRVASML